MFKIAMVSTKERCKKRKRRIEKKESIALNKKRKKYEINTFGKLAEYVEKGDPNFKNLKLSLEHIKSIDEMVGLQETKSNALRLIKYFLNGFHINSESMNNIVVYGKPGTGKTKFCEHFGYIVGNMGVLKGNGKYKFRKVTRKDLIGKYTGQTAPLTASVIEDSLGGVLYIDEVYSLFSDDEYSKEALTTLMERISHYKNSIIVIISGYEENIFEQLYTMNPGIERRFPRKWKFDTYSKNELWNIFKYHAAKEGFKINFDFDLPPQIRDNSGVGEIIYLLTCCKEAHSERIFTHGEEKYKFTVDDIRQGIEEYSLAYAYIPDEKLSHFYI